MAKRKVHIAVVGVGGMGQAHLRFLAKVREAQVVGVVDVNPELVGKVSAEWEVPGFSSVAELVRTVRPAAVSIASPHPVHLRNALDCFRRGLHVFTEKPLCSLTSEADKMIAAARKRRRVLAEMFQYRAMPPARRAREIIDKGTIGKIVRVNMVHVGLRTNEYYRSRPWRGTWAGEGGGVLLNQSPHTIDRAIFLAGMPGAVTARCLTVGHPIETEDHAEALLEYPGGATGYFLMTTAEHPGINQLEITGERGRVLIDDEAGKLFLWTMKQPLPQFLKTCRQAWKFPKAACKEIDLAPRCGEDTAHHACLRDFCLTVLGRRKKPMITGEDGRRSLELANAITLSAFKGGTVKLPLGRREYDQLFAFCLKRGRGRKIQETIAAWRRARKR